MFVSATISPPARRMRSTTPLSAEGTKPESACDPHVHGTPATPTQSFSEIVFPERGPDASALTRHQRTTALSGSSADSGARPGSRAASTTGTAAAPRAANASIVPISASERSLNCSCSPGAIENPLTRANSFSSSTPGLSRANASPVPRAPPAQYNEPAAIVADRAWRSIDRGPQLSPGSVAGAAAAVAWLRLVAWLLAAVPEEVVELSCACAAAVCEQFDGVERACSDLDLG